MMASTLYPEISPNKTMDLKVDDIHTIYVEESGNPTGTPVVVVHGGPGGGTNPLMRRYFDPKIWRIILFDQRGCGQSTPFSELRNNTTWHLVEDMEKIRQQLGIEQWAVFGGSWGSTLALAYGVTHPQRVLGLVLRGIFLLRKKEIDWFYQQGASEIFPEAWESYLAPIPQDKRNNLLKAYYERLISSDVAVRSEAARAWSVWEGSTSKLLYDPSFVDKFGQDAFADAFARIEAHYFINRGFFNEDNFLLNHAHKIKHLPCYIVQGRYDVVCPATSAFELHKTLPQSKLEIVADAGHSATEPGIEKKLIDGVHYLQAALKI